jgi:hypothetical protein
MNNRMVLLLSAGLGEKQSSVKLFSIKIDYTDFVKILGIIKSSMIINFF